MTQLKNLASVLDAAFEQSFNAIVVSDADLTDGGPHIVLCNPAFCAMTGYPQDELIGQGFQILQGPGTDRELMARLKDCLISGQFFVGSTINYRKDRTPYVVEWNVSPITDAEQNITHFVSVQQDITARVDAERNRDMLAEAVRVASDAVMITDANAVIVFVNPAFEALTGYSADEVVGTVAKELRDHGADPQLYANLLHTAERRESVRATADYSRKDGTSFFIDYSMAPVLDASGEVAFIATIAKDVSGTVRRQRKLQELAGTDPLTGLLNRRAGDEELQICHRDATESGDAYSLIMCDLDFFKRVNDEFGHAAGDRVLSEVARILIEAQRSTDFVVRWGGEEFLVMLPDTSVRAAAKVAERMRAEIESADQAEIARMTISMGVAEWSRGDTVDDVLARADAALYAAKAAGRNRVCLSP